MYPKLLTFTIFGKSITLYSYGLFISLAIILGIVVFMRRARKKGLDTSGIFDLIILIILIGLIGARLGYVLLHIDYYRENLLDIFKIWQGGLTFYGALIFGLVTVFLLLIKKERRKLWLWLDAALPPIVLANAIGKIGCFLNGCCYGKESHVLWAIKIPAQDGILRHPVQLYEALAYFLVFIILILTERKSRFSGFIFTLGLILHSVARFNLEWAREWVTTINIAKIKFSDGQIISLVFLLDSILGFVYLMKKIWKKNL